MQIVRTLVAVAASVLAAAPGAVAPAAAGPAYAGATTCQETFTSPGSAVPAQTQYTIALPVSAAGTVADVDVRIWGDAPATSFSLARASAGPAVLLDGFSGATLDGATFDDEAAGPKPPDLTVYSGTYLPQEALSGFDGLPVADTWQLLVDNQSITTNVISPWELVVTYADCVVDTDGDGVPDETDLCPTVAAPTASGCPTIARDLTFRWSDGSWHGRLTADRAACSRERPVRVYRVDAGADTRVATATTRRDGAWTDPAARPRGKFYALAPKVLVPGVGICAKVRTSDKSY